MLKRISLFLGNYYFFVHFPRRGIAFVERGACSVLIMSIVSHKTRRGFRKEKERELGIITSALLCSAATYILLFLVRSAANTTTCALNITGFSTVIGCH